MTTVTQFGQELLRTGDLDPVYVAIHKAKLDEPTLARLCLAYWCFYDLGTAARLAEITSPKKYWDKMMVAAMNEGEPKPWPRGAERRHYRGAQAVMSMSSLISMYPKGAQYALEGFIGHGHKGKHTYASVSSAVQTHRGFGMWIAWKIADMSERVLGYDTDFTDCSLGIYHDPRQGAAVAYLEDMGTKFLNGYVKPWEYPITDDQLSEIVDRHVKNFRAMKLKAPPGNDRLVNIQEIETIFCKFKSHLKGHYEVGKDVIEVGHGLLLAKTDLAAQLHKGLPVLKEPRNGSH